MKILLIGGHLSPLLAIIEALRVERADDIVIVSRKYSAEGSRQPSTESIVLTQAGIRTVLLTTGRLQRQFSRYTIPSLLRIPIGFLQAWQILRRERPQVVVGFGGYLSVPIVVAAALLGIPTVIHEQSVKAGLANRLLGKIASVVLLSWQSSLPFFPSQKSMVIGNPIMAAFFARQANDETIAAFIARHRGVPIISVTGGNQGSHVINEAVFGALPKLLEKFALFHQVGSINATDAAFAEQIQARLPDQLRERYLARPFVASADLAALFTVSTVIVSRAGANTVSEIAALGKPALFIPIPWAQQNEQEENAKLLVAIGIAEILPQPALNAPTLFGKINAMVMNRGKYLANSSRAKDLIEADTAAQIVLEIKAAAKIK